MAELTALTIAEIRDGLAAKQFSALELTDAYLAAIEAANPLLNAYIVTTPERAREWRGPSDERIGRGEARALEGVPLGIKDLFCTEGVHSQAASHILDGFQAALRVHRHRKSVGRRRSHARQAQHGRVRHGLLQRDQFLRPGGQSLAEGRWRQHQAGARRFVRRLGGGGGGAALRRGDGHRYGRLDPPAGSLYRDGGDQADLWPLLALGDRGFASSLDQAGPIARTVRDAAILLKSMASVDPKDSTRPRWRCRITRRQWAEACAA
jgi:aspartyl-tRNA(Asn)/glutamyl-tRNA(Gln) amidotransferase subunit A